MKLGQSGSKLAEMGAAETFVGMAILASPLLPTRDSKESIRRSSTKVKLKFLANFDII